MSKIIDIYDLGKNTFNSSYTQLNNNKKVLSHYLKCIEEYLDSIEENKNHLSSINRKLDKYTSIDKPFCFLKKFEIILKNQCEYLDDFLDLSQKTFEHLKESLNTTLAFISGFLAKTKEYSENIKSNSAIFFQKFDKFNKSLEETEKSIVEDYIKNTYNIQINKDKNIIYNIEELVNESRKNEKELLESKINMENLFKNFLMEYNCNMKEIKQKMTKLNEDCKNDILNVIQINKNNCNNILTLLNSNSQIIEQFDIKNNNFEKGYSEYLNNEIKEDELFQVLNLEKYKLKIIREEERNKIEKKMNNQSSNQNNLNNSNSNIKNKNNKTSNNKKNSLNSTNSFSINNNNKNKLNHLFIITPRDEYKIIKKLYSYNFEKINKDDYNLTIEKGKLEVIKLTSKILGYDFDKYEHFKIEEMSKNEINYTINFIFSQEEYIKEFLILFNNYRAKGKLELSLYIFNIIKNIFDKAADYLLLKPNNKIADYMVILSQTFYILKDNKKYFLLSDLKNKKFFHSENYWINKLERSIKEELERYEEDLIKNKIDIKENNKKKKKEEIIFSNMISYVTSLNGFELEKEIIDKIIFPLFDKYNISDEKRKMIFSLIDAYKNKI
jgi:hypothetical protein